MAYVRGGKYPGLLATDSPFHVCDQKLGHRISVEHLLSKIVGYESKKNMYLLVEKCSVLKKRLLQHKTDKQGKRLYVDVDGLMPDGTGMFETTADEFVPKPAWRKNYPCFDNFHVQAQSLETFLAAFYHCGAIKKLGTCRPKSDYIPEFNTVSKQIANKMKQTPFLYHTFHG